MCIWILCGCLVTIKSVEMYRSIWYFVVAKHEKKYFLVLLDAENLPR